jgi:predicted AAA+ superfamily ATPase
MSIELPQFSLVDLLDRLDRVLDTADRVLSAQLVVPTDDVLDDAIAFNWQRRHGSGQFRLIRHPDLVHMDDLLGIDRQRDILLRNTRQFLRGAPANHVLLWGERGSGKSSIVKALLHRFASEGLRLVQLHRHDLLDLPEVVDRLWDRPEKYILFCDDLSFEDGDAAYKELKALLEGGLSARPANLLIYATSNRRHLMPEHMADRQAIATMDDVHPNEAMEEKLSLADRFGIRLGFYKVDQGTYLAIVRHLVATRGLRVDNAEVEREALRWALSYSGRSGRSARQFVDDLEGRLALEQ